MREYNYITAYDAVLPLRRTTAGSSCWRERQICRRLPPRRTVAARNADLTACSVNTFRQPRRRKWVGVFW